MDPKYPHFSLRTVLNFLLVFLLHKSAQAQDEICNSSPTAEIDENNAPGAVVTTINTLAGVTLAFKTDTNTDSIFALNGDQLIAAKALDYETSTTHTVYIQCIQGELEFSLTVIVLVQNVNDHPPIFAQSQYTLDVDELTPVGTLVHEGTIQATDADNNQLYYLLEPDTEGFKLEGNRNPTLEVQKLLDYDTVKHVTLTLYAWDTPTADALTATTTININIKDIDNRPPWFQPCTETIVGTAKLCLNSGYTGTVNLTEQETGALPLQPGPVHAIDGDSLNAAIMYTFLGGNEDGIFHINENGNITMQKAVDVAGPLVLTVLAAQRTNSDQYATTTVTFDVVIKSTHPPRFEKTQYEGFIAADAGQGSMVMEEKSSSKPLKVQAKDADFANGMNPDMKYEIQGTSDFSVTEQGFILMTKELSPGSVSFDLKAVDSSNGEASTAPLVVEVTPGTPTSTSPPTTIEMTSVTKEMTSETLDPTTNPSLTTQDNLPTSLSGNTADPHITDGGLGSSGGYRQEDMAALGASLAVLLIICMVVIGLLVFRIQKGKADWRKLSEASIFRNALGRGSGGPKEGVQYTNEGFQNDGDTGSMGSKGLEDLDVQQSTRAGTSSTVEEAILKTLQFSNLLPDDSSLAGSDKADSEKEVKPILTKERRVEEGYKSVWFKEDIDPNAKEEVVIIPDSREQDGEDDEDEGSLGDEEEESYDNDNSVIATPKVFANGDLDNGLKPKGNQESDDEDMLTSDL